jgi:hypothetical protein
MPINKPTTRILSIDEVVVGKFVRFQAEIRYPNPKVGEVTATCVFPLTNGLGIKMKDLPKGAIYILGESVCFSLRARVINLLNANHGLYRPHE